MYSVQPPYPPIPTFPWAELETHQDNPGKVDKSSIYMISIRNSVPGCCPTVSW